MVPVARLALARTPVMIVPTTTLIEQNKGHDGNAGVFACGENRDSATGGWSYYGPVISLEMRQTGLGRVEVEDPHLPQGAS